LFVPLDEPILFARDLVTALAEPDPSQDFVFVTLTFIA